MQLPEHVDGTLFRTPNELCNLIKDEIPADHKGRCIGGCWLLVLVLLVLVLVLVLAAAAVILVMVVEVASHPPPDCPCRQARRCRLLRGALP